jgi:glycosyltransferase involved in cell wall biosynthesis
MRNGKKISVVIPCYNEEEGIRLVLERMPDFVDEVIVVDNASTDGTAKVATELGARVINETRKGYGRAYKTGFRAAQCDVIVTMDGDATYPTIAIGYLLDVLEADGLDFISARRVASDWKDSFDSVLRYLGNKIFNLFVILLYFRHLRDCLSGMWVFRRSVLEKIDAHDDGMSFSEEIKLEAFCNKQLKCREVPIMFKYATRAGEAKLSPWKDGFNGIAFFFGKRFDLGRLPGSILKDN